MATTPIKYDPIRTGLGFDTVTFQGEPIVRIPGGFGASNGDGTKRGGTIGSPATGGSGVGTGGTYGPGQAARFVPDPTVNGPWTHTDASIPLFKQPPPVTTPAIPAPGSGPIGGPGGGQPHVARPPGSWQHPPGTPGTPGAPGSGHYGMHWGRGHQNNPALQQWRTSMDAWRQQRPASRGDEAAYDTWRQQRPHWRDRRSMLADAVAGD